MTLMSEGSISLRTRSALPVSSRIIVFVCSSQPGRVKGDFASTAFLSITTGSAPLGPPALFPICTSPT
ncbi:hypothetical protein B0H19DRAFT_1167810 [Mycena capillaripes]|nr:hypothetical protein B0H19DRAFT_1167810 [Mycena capillaripes]